MVACSDLFFSYWTVTSQKQTAHHSRPVRYPSSDVLLHRPYSATESGWANQSCRQHSISDYGSYSTVARLCELQYLRAHSISSQYFTYLRYNVVVHHSSVSTFSSAFTTVTPSPPSMPLPVPACYSPRFLLFRSLVSTYSFPRSCCCLVQCLLPAPNTLPLLRRCRVTPGYPHCGRASC